MRISSPGAAERVATTMKKVTVKPTRAGQGKRFQKKLWRKLRLRRTTKATKRLVELKAEPRQRKPSRRVLARRDRWQLRIRTTPSAFLRRRADSCSRRRLLSLLRMKRGNTPRIVE
jgi:hypothetical protein